jgi:hypothetical protein
MKTLMKTACYTQRLYDTQDKTDYDRRREAPHPRFHGLVYGTASWHGAGLRGH